MYKEYLLDVVAQEKKFLLKGDEDFGEYFHHTLQCGELVSNFIKKPSHLSYVFMSFYTIIKKHYTLAVLSSINRHHAQTNYNIRYMLESSCFAAYALSNPNIKNFIELDNDNKISLYKPRTNVFKWLEKNYPNHSLNIQNKKESINKSTAHSNFKYTHKVFNVIDNNSREMKFFDIENKDHTKVDLFNIVNSATLILDLLLKIYKDSNTTIIELQNDSEEKLRHISQQNQKLMEELLHNKANKIAKA